MLGKLLPPSKCFWKFLSRAAAPAKARLKMMKAAVVVLSISCFVLSGHAFGLNFNPVKFSKEFARKPQISCYSRRKYVCSMVTKVQSPSSVGNHSVLSKTASWIRSLIVSMALLVSGFDGAELHRNLPIKIEASAPAMIHRVAFADSGLANQVGKEKSDSAIMLSMSTPASKKRLVALVSGAYAIIWAFFFFTHDKGEKSE